MRAVSGFTLIETMIALAIYAVLIAALVVVNRSGLDTFSELESRALARLALANVVTEFRQAARQGKRNARIGRHHGQYRMSHFQYQWQIQLSRSQNQHSQLLDAYIRLQGSEDNLATLREVW